MSKTNAKRQEDSQLAPQKAPNKGSLELPVSIYMVPWQKQRHFWIPNKKYYVQPCLAETKMAPKGFLRYGCCIGKDQSVYMRRFPEPQHFFAAV